jgi:protein-tyrosine phosphatase
LCILGTKYLLLEMPFEPWSKRTMNEVSGLITGYEIIPIIAHIERYANFHNSKEKISELLEMGALIQMNAEFLLSRLTRKAALKFLAMEQVHLLGSDRHSSKDHRADLRAAAKIIRRRLGEARMNTMDAFGREVLSTAQKAPLLSFESPVIKL